MTTPPPVGQRLKDERVRLGLQRVDVTRATKIYVHHLAALEFGRYDELPDERIVESYVRAYVEHRWATTHTDTVTTSAAS